MSSSTLADFCILSQPEKGSYGTVFQVRQLVNDRLHAL